jgi:hypothetical protein
MHPLLAPSAPGCRLLGVAALARHSLRFHSRSADPRDRSGKCNALRTGRAGDVVHGVVFQMHEQHRPEIGGSGGGYRWVQVRVTLAAGPVEAQALIADPAWIDPSLIPYDWHLAVIGSGARIHGLPADYQARLRSVATQPDPDRRRANRFFEFARGTRKIRPFFRKPRA